MYILLVICTDERGLLLTRNDRWFLRGCWKKLVESVASGRCGFRKRRVLCDGRQEWIIRIHWVRTAYKFSSCSTSFMKIYISLHNPILDTGIPEFLFENLLLTCSSTWPRPFYMTWGFLCPPHSSPLTVSILQISPSFHDLPWYLFLISTISVLCGIISCSTYIFCHLWQLWFGGQEGGRCESG